MRLSRARIRGYNGLGALQWAQDVTTDITAEDVTTDALGRRLRMRDVGLIENGLSRTLLSVVEARSGRAPITTC